VDITLELHLRHWLWHYTRKFATRHVEDVCAMAPSFHVLYAALRYWGSLPNTG